MSLKTKQERLCIKCQACCKLIAIPMKQPSAAAMKFYRTKGCRLAYNSYKVLCLVVPSICPQLTKDGCKIYDNRPEDCRVYDGRKDPLLKSVCLWDKRNQGVLKKGTPRVKEA